MVDLPSVPRRLVTTDQIQNRVSPADVAAPARAFADMLGEGGQALADYQKAADAGTYARLSDEVRTQAQKLAIDANGNPEGFQKSWEVYSRNVLKKAPGMSGKLIENDLRNLGGSTFRELVGTRYKQNTSNAKVAIETEQARVTNDLLSMAARGEIGTPEYAASREKYRTLNAELSGNPAFGVAPEAAKYADDRLEADLIRESVRHKVETLYRDDPAAARKYAEEALNDPAVPMTAVERRKAVADAMTWHDKLSAEARLDRTDYRADAREITRTLIDTDAVVNPQDIAEAIARGKAMRDYGTVRRLEDAARLRDLRTGFRALPVGKEKLGVFRTATSGGGATVLDQAREAIAVIESAGSGDYAARGPVTKRGDRAYGRYQVMGANIPEWTQAALGTRMTPQQFLADPAAQDAVFNHRFGSYIEKYGNSLDAASAWFTGRPRSAASGRSADITGTTGNAYVAKFARLLGGTAGTPYDPVVINAYRKELGTDLAGLIDDAKDVIGREIGLDADTAGLLVDYARAVNDPAKIREVDKILDESGVHNAIHGMTPEERQGFKALLASPDGPIGDDAVRARMLAAEERNAAHYDKLLADNPLRYGVEKGWYPPDPPLDFAGPDLAKNLSVRSEKLRIVGEHEGVAPRSALYPEETKAVAAYWQAADVPKRLALVGSMTQGLTPENLMATLSGFADKADTKALAIAGALSTTAPEIGAAVIRGEAALATNPGFGFDKSATDYKTAVETHFPSTVVAADPNAQKGWQAMLDAARLVYADGSAKTGVSTGKFDETRWQAAIDAVTGGVLDFNGQKIIAPRRDVDQSRFDDIMASMPGWVLGGAVTPSGTPISPSDLKKHGTLASYGDGRYLLRFGDSYALASPRDGEVGVGGPFVLDLGPMLNASLPRVVGGDFTIPFGRGVNVSPRTIWGPQPKPGAILGAEAGRAIGNR